MLTDLYYELACWILLSREEPLESDDPDLSEIL